MAKVSFTSDLNIKPQRQTFPKLTGLKTGEKVRIQLVSLDDIDMEFVHNLEIPVIEDGKGILNDKGKFKTSYKGSPLSFGDLSILEDKGIDVKNCPISAVAAKYPDRVQPPRRKFAMHILQYRTKPNSFDLATPFNVEHKVWVFTERTYLKLQSFVKEWGDLRQHDLYITCENDKFQQYDISVAPRAAWRDKPEDTKFAVETYKAGKEEYPDLSLAIGQRKEKQWVIQDLAEIEEAWNIVSGKGHDDGFPANQELDDLLGLGGGTDASEPNVLAELADAGASEEDGGVVQDFDDLLKGL